MHRNCISEEEKEEWAIHIIDRFEEEAYIYAVEDGFHCPCEALNWVCRLCDYNDPEVRRKNDYANNMGCQEADAFFSVCNACKEDIKEKIRNFHKKGGV